MWQEGQWCPDEANNACADESVFGCPSCSGASRSNEADDEAAGNHAGDPCRVVIALGTDDLHRRLPQQIEVDTKHIGMIEPEAHASWVAERIAKEIGVS